mgnify:CR=1 FL=1
MGWYQEKVVEPVRRTIPTLGETPVGMASQHTRDFFRNVREAKPGETVKIGLPWQIEDVPVEEFKGLGAVDTGWKKSSTAKAKLQSLLIHGLASQLDEYSESYILLKKTDTK